MRTILGVLVKRKLTILAVMATLTLALTSVALGADGDFFKVGKSNFASSVSKLIKNGAGPALDLQVGSGPPLKVNSQVKVANLNADSLDGKDSTQFGPPDIFATVLADGTLWGPASTPQAVSANRSSTGVYNVQFNQSVDQVGCVHLAQSLDTVAFTQTIAGPRYGGPPTEVRVRQFDHAGTPVNGAVSLVVFCK